MADDLVGKTLGPYEILSVLGRGPNSLVYRAYQADANRTVAVKVLAPELGQEPDFEARFERDVRRLAELDHPHIIPLFDAGVVSGYPFIIMQHMSGGTLANLLARYGKLSLAESVPIIQQVGAALDYAHSKGIIHRYLKPSNILMDEAGEAYVTDFGIGQVREAVASAHQSGVLSGAAYISPEVISAVKRITGAADVYSLGVILFEMLTGNLPFKGSNAAATARMHLTENPPSASAMNADLPPAIDAVLAKALAKQPKDRFVSVGAMADALAAAAGIDTNAARQRPSIDTGTGQMRRPPMPAAPPKAPGGAHLTPPPGTIKAFETEPVTPPPGTMPALDAEMLTPPPGYITPPLGAYDEADLLVGRGSGSTPPPSGSHKPASGTHAKPPSGTFSKPPSGTFDLPPETGSKPGTGSPISLTDLPAKERRKLKKERERQRKELRRRLGVTGTRWYTFVLAVILVVVAWFMIGVLAGNQLRRQQQQGALAGIIADRTATADAIAAIPTSTGEVVAEVTLADTPIETLVIPPTETATPTETPSPTPTATVTASPTPTQMGGSRGQIAFISQRDGDADVYVYDLATGGTSQLTRNDATEAWPAWSPDGTALTYSSKDSGVPTQHIFMLTLADTAITQLTVINRIDSYPIWSPEGDQIAFHAFDGARSFLRTVTPDGNDDLLGQIPVAENRLLDWSPDGFIWTLFGYSSAGVLEILRFDIDTQARTPISSANGGIEYLNYSADRSKVVFTRFTPTGRQIYIADNDPDCPIVTDCNPRRVTNDRLNWQRPQFSPDGTLILASSNQAGNLDVFILTFDGTILQQITTSPSDDYDAVWQPR